MAAMLSTVCDPDFTYKLSFPVSMESEHKSLLSSAKRLQKYHENICFILTKWKSSVAMQISSYSTYCMTTECRQSPTTAVLLSKFVCDRPAGSGKCGRSDAGTDTRMLARVPSYKLTL